MVMIFLLSAGTWLTATKAEAHRHHAYHYFYNELRPYGNWIFMPEYGQVWIPDAGPGFHPYSTNGYWTYTYYGWTWVSYYNWGWAPFHYGRWYYDNWYGWVWVPGSEWGPGWVSWRHCDGYYGWAPLGPGVHVNINININIPMHHWVFVDHHHFGNADMGRHYAPRTQSEQIFKRSTMIENTTLDRETNTRYYAGPAVKEVAKVTGREYKPVEVPEKRALPERQYTHNERTVKNETPVVRYDRPERQAQPAPKQTPNTVRNERPEQPPVKKQYTAPVRNDYQAKPVERKNTTPPVRTTEKPQVKKTTPEKQATPAKKSPTERAPR